MINHSTTEVFFEDLELGADALIGEQGEGFRYILDGMNVERILIASECIGDCRFFLDRAVAALLLTRRRSAAGIRARRPDAPDL